MYETLSGNRWLPSVFICFQTVTIWTNNPWEKQRICALHCVQCSILLLHTCTNDWKKRVLLGRDRAYVYRWRPETDAVPYTKSLCSLVVCGSQVWLDLYCYRTVTLLAYSLSFCTNWGHTCAHTHVHTMATNTLSKRGLHAYYWAGRYLKRMILERNCAYWDFLCYSCFANLRRCSHYGENGRDGHVHGGYVTWRYCSYLSLVNKSKMATVDFVILWIVLAVLYRCSRSTNLMSKTLPRSHGSLSWLLFLSSLLVPFLFG